MLAYLWRGRQWEQYPSSWNACPCLDPPPAARSPLPLSLWRPPPLHASFLQCSHRLPARHQDKEKGWNDGSCICNSLVDCDTVVIHESGFWYWVYSIMHFWSYIGCTRIIAAHMTFSPTGKCTAAKSHTLIVRFMQLAQAKNMHAVIV